MAALGEHEAGSLRPAEEGKQDGGLLVPMGVEALRLARIEEDVREFRDGLAQMIT
jgi:hypothetical protein